MSSYSQKFLEEIANNNDRDANHVAQGIPMEPASLLTPTGLIRLAAEPQATRSNRRPLPAVNRASPGKQGDQPRGITEFALG